MKQCFCCMIQPVEIIVLVIEKIPHLLIRKPGLDTGIRPLELSLAKDDATFLRPACYGELNQCFLQFHKSKKCQVGGIITRQLSRRVAIGSSCSLCGVADHQSRAVAPHFLRPSCFSAGGHFANYRPNIFGASWPIAPTTAHYPVAHFCVRPYTTAKYEHCITLASGPHSSIRAPFCPCPIP